jgi:predicted nucleic acid-binding protein
LALKQAGSRIVLDECKGRKIAKRLNLKVTGTVGLVVKAKEPGLITSGKAVLTQLESHGFWLSEELKRQILARRGFSDAGFVQQIKQERSVIFEAFLTSK